jgi:uncharacterized phage-associated protein
VSSPLFDEEKVTQVAALLLKWAGGSMNYMKLLKLLYFIDRGSLKKWGAQVTGDDLYFMENGPVLSRTLDLIKKPLERTLWSRYISQPHDYEVAVKRDPGTKRLSRDEIELAQNVFAEYGSLRPFDLVKITHDLREWKKPKGKRELVQIKHLLKAIGKSSSEIQRIEQERAHEGRIRKLLAS